MKKILFDCDNTMGLPEKDVDDGITLLYLLGEAEADLLGITSTFGNGEIEEVNQVIKRMLKELGINDLPFYCGAGNAEDINTPAADFLLEQARNNAGELTLLATGALTNLKAAWKKDPEFFSYLKEIRVMGGITENLIFGDKEIKELNFSCDPEAARLVLEAPVPVMVATGNLCLDAFFNSEDWQWLSSQEDESYTYIADNIEDWYYFGEKLINEPGFHLWDLVAALYITYPKLYEDSYYKLKSGSSELKRGKLKLKKTAAAINEEGVINIPTRIKDLNQFKELIFSAWGKLSGINKR